MRRMRNVRKQLQQVPLPSLDNAPIGFRAGLAAYPPENEALAHDWPVGNYSTLVMEAIERLEQAQPGLSI